MGQILLINEVEPLGKVSSDRFIKLSRKYEEEQSEIAQKIRQIQKEISKQEDHLGTADAFYRYHKKY